VVTLTMMGTDWVPFSGVEVGLTLHVASFAAVVQVKEGA
jgi:hypothetical protein